MTAFLAFALYLFISGLLLRIILSDGVFLSGAMLPLGFVLALWVFWIGPSMLAAVMI